MGINILSISILVKVVSSEITIFDMNPSQQKP